jgi:hypothetical protein
VRSSQRCERSWQLLQDGLESAIETIERLRRERDAAAESSRQTEEQLGAAMALWLASMDDGHSLRREADQRDRQTDLGSWVRRSAADRWAVWRRSRSSE